MYKPKTYSLLFVITGITSFSTSSILIAPFFDFICFSVKLRGFSFGVTLLKSSSSIICLNPLFNHFALIDLS